MIDCDPGVDDALALLLALASPEVALCGITTVAGNMPLETTTRNALRLLELAGRTDVPVAAGCARPLVARRGTSASSHGTDGLGDVGLPAPSIAPVAEHAIDLMARLGRERPFTLVAIGPLTNVALLLARHPGAPSWLERVVVMGGSASEGNITPAAEFNIWSDPEAASRVFDAGLDLTVAGLHVTRRAYLDDHDLQRLAEAPGRCARAAAGMLAGYRASYLDSCGSPHMPMHDPLAVYDAIDPAALTKSRGVVTVDCSYGATRGATLIERDPATGQGGLADVAWALDRSRFVDFLVERLSSLS